MTKKFWNDWKERFGETKEIILQKNATVYNTDHIGYVLGRCKKDRIVDAEWHEDSVLLKIERYTISIKNTNEIHYALMGIFPILLYRNDIYTVKFKKI